MIIPLWRNRDFRLLFAAQIISLLGSGVTTVGLALFAYQLTGGTSATVIIGHALMLRILAFLLFSQPAGVIADRVSRKQILIAADLLRCALLAEHTFEEERGRAYAAHFALTHACWLITYPAVGHAAARWGAPVTFTAAGVVCLLITAAAKALGRGSRSAHVHDRQAASGSLESSPP